MGASAISSRRKSCVSDNPWNLRLSPTAPVRRAKTVRRWGPQCTTPARTARDKGSAKPGRHIKQGAQMTCGMPSAGLGDKAPKRTFNTPASHPSNSAVPGPASRPIGRPPTRVTFEQNPKSKPRPERHPDTQKTISKSIWHLGDRVSIMDWWPNHKETESASGSNGTLLIAMFMDAGFIFECKSPHQP